MTFSGQYRSRWARSTNLMRSTSAGVNCRYPDRVRVGVTSPSASRKRTLETVTSGNSSARLSTTAPTVRGRPAVGGVTRERQPCAAA